MLAAQEQEARTVAEYQLEQSLELGETLQLRLLETEAELRKVKQQKDIPMMVRCSTFQISGCQ